MTARVTAVLDAAAATHRRALAPTGTDGIGLAVVCATWGVPGLADGLYLHDPPGGGLRPLAAGGADLDAGDLVPGAERAEVQAVAVVVGALAVAVACHGEAGHRLLLVAAGLLTAALADAAGRLSVPCCEVAQVFPHPLRQRAGVDGYRWTALSAVVLGHPSVPDPPSSLSFPKGGEIQ